MAVASHPKLATTLNHAKMDESTAMEMREDGVENQPETSETSFENNDCPSTEDSARIEQCSIECKDCGLKFEHQEDYKTHLHQHALEEEDGTMDDKNPAAGSVSKQDDEVAKYENVASSPAQGFVENSSVTCYNADRKIYTCSECGKSYTYLVSFQKHLQLHGKSPSDPKKEIERNTVLPNYECPECGMSFIRRTRLISHMRVHRKKKVKPSILGCDQCNRTFNSLVSWMAHLELHRQRPFWCLNCALGFRSEETLDEHLINHCMKQKPLPLKPFYVKKRGLGEKLYQCHLCGKTFCHPKRLFSHRKKHLRGHAWSKGVPKESFNQSEGDNEKESTITKVENTESNTDTDKLPRSENEAVTPQHNDQCESHDATDCGEPRHCSKPSKPNCVESENSTSNIEMDENNSEKTNVHSDHKYWEWECYLCDEGFDDVGELHLHYIKHARGEVPVPQYDEIEDEGSLKKE